MKLQCIENEYYLTDTGRTIATTDKELLNDMIGAKKLSKQNCDEIFGVVDVEKLACDECHIDISAYKIIQTLKSGHSKSELQLESKVDGFILGFNKAMELNKDKLFTANDMMQAIITTQVSDAVHNNEDRLELIQSLQQPTEIEVEIVTYVDLAATPVDSRHPDAYLGTDTGIPFLDENGCLILKNK
jgi:hypothetical protein